MRVWHEYIEFCLRSGATAQLHRVVLKALKFHSRDARLWVTVADRELQLGNFQAARSLLVRALRFCGSESPTLWAEYLKLELRRIRVLLDKSTAKTERERAAKEKQTDSGVSLAGEVLAQMTPQAANGEGASSSSSSSSSSSGVTEQKSEEDARDERELEDSTAPEVELDFNATFAIVKVVLRQAIRKLTSTDAVLQFLRRALEMTRLLDYAPWTEHVVDFVHKDVKVPDASSNENKTYDERRLAAAAAVALQRMKLEAHLDYRKYDTEEARESALEAEIARLVKEVTVSAPVRSNNTSATSKSARARSDSSDEDDSGDESESSSDDDDISEDEPELKRRKIERDARAVAGEEHFEIYDRVMPMLKMLFNSLVATSKKVKKTGAEEGADASGAGDEDDDDDLDAMFTTDDAASKSTADKANAALAKSVSAASASKSDANKAGEHNVSIDMSSMRSVRVQKRITLFIEQCWSSLDARVKPHVAVLLSKNAVGKRME